MIYLVLSILISSSLYVIFKLFEKYRIDNFQAIVINYVVACTSGLLLFPSAGSILEITAKPWFLSTVVLGFLFISVFFIMAGTAQKNGLSVAAIAAKMSVVIPVIFAYFVYGDPMGTFKLTGIVLALFAVYLASLRTKKLKVEPSNLIYPVLLFAGSGVIDTMIKYYEVTYVSQEEIPLFSSAIFGNAAIIGVVIMSYLLLSGRQELKVRNVLGGIALGVPNYFSIFFILKALKQGGMDSSSIFTINNVAIVMLTTVFGIVLFKEHLIAKNWLGVILAVISIFLITYATT